MSAVPNRWLRNKLFAINFSIAALLFTCCVVGILAAGNSFAFFGGMFCFLPTGLYAVGEWVAWYRDNQRVERWIAAASFYAGGLLAFGAIANQLQYLADAGDSNTMSLGELIAFFAVSAYLLACGWLRFGWSRQTRRMHRAVSVSGGEGSSRACVAERD